MFRVLSTFALVFMLLFAMNAKEIHVSKSGNNSNQGTAASPYLTIQKAANVASAGDIVIIHAGTYEETVTPANSGSSGNPIVYKSAPGEKVIISAMQAISGWSLDKDNVYKTSVSWDLGQDNMVLHGDKLMDLARWPNNTSQSPFPLTYNVMTSGGSNWLEYSPGIPNWNWADGGSMHFYGAAGFLAWKEYITKVDGNRVYFNLVRNENWIPEKHNPGYTGHGIYDGEFFLQGIREALDYKNEWFYNSSSKTLYVQIEGGGKPVDGAVMMRKRKQCINITKNYTHFENLAVFGGSIDISGNNNKLTQVSSFYGNYTLGVVNTFSAKNQSVYIDGNNNTVEKCEIAYGAASGLTDKGDYNKVLNCYIHHFNFLGNYDCVLNTRGAVGAKYLNNRLEYGGRDIIQAYADNSEYAYNDVAWSNIVADDCALLYTTNTRSTKSTIHHNHFHDAASKGKRFKAAGIYLDNRSKNWDVHHNVVYNTEWTNIQINWDGTNLNIFNNTFVKGNGTMGAWYNGYEFSNVKVYNNLTDEETIDKVGNQETESTWVEQAEKKNNLISKESFLDYVNNNFTLKAGAPAIDYGIVISGITDGYSGSKPDVGAYEFGQNWTAGIDWDPSVGPTGNGCYGLPGETCGSVVVPTKDAISFANLPSEIEQSTLFSVSIAYTATESRDVIAILNDPNGNWLGNGKATVNKGTGVATVNVELASLPALGSNYQLALAIRPVGSGNWSDNTDETSTTVNIVEDVINADYVEFVNLPTEIEQAISYTGRIKYESLGARDLCLIVSKPDGTWFAVGKKQIEAGAGKIDVTVDFPSLPELGDGYKFDITIRPVGGNYASNTFNQLKLVNIVKEVLEEDPTIIIIEAEDYKDTDGTIDDSSFDNGPAGVGVKNDGSIMNWVNNGDWAEYTINVSGTDSYTITYKIASPYSNTNINLLVDDAEVATDIAPNTGDWGVNNTWTELTSTTKINLTAGTHTIRIQPGEDTWNWNLDWIKLTPSSLDLPTNMVESVITTAVSPNPVDNYVIITSNQEIKNIILYHANGSLIFNKTINSLSKNIATSNLLPGVYILKVQTQDGTWITKKLMKN